MAAHGRLVLCHRDDVTNFIAIAYSCSCKRFPSSDPSFTIRCPRALKTLCGRLEIVDRRDDHALISAAGHHRHDCRCHRTTIERRTLLDINTKWQASSTSEHVFKGRDQGTGELRWTGTAVDLVFGSNSQLRAIAEVYACDDSQQAFVRDFVTAWDKVMNLDRFDLA